MRMAFALLLLLSACGSKTDHAGDGGGGQQSAVGLEPPLPTAPSAAQLQAQASTALATVLLNPKDARYTNVRTGAPGAVCGEVDSRQENGRFGGPRPFVVTPDGVAVVSPTTRVMFGNPADLFPDFYIRWCATPAELAKLGPGIREEEPPEDPANVTAAPDVSLPPPATDPQLPPAPPPAPRAEAKATRPDQPPEPKAGKSDDDSFFNAVIRKKE